MYVCICQSVREIDIRQACSEGVRSFAELQDRTRCSTGCGCCESMARQLLHELTLRQSLPSASRKAA